MQHVDSAEASESDDKVDFMKTSKCLFQSQAICVCLAAQEILVKFASLLDDPQSELLVHSFIIESKLILGLAIWCFVVAEPNSDFVHLSRKFPAANQTVSRKFGRAALGSHCLHGKCNSVATIGLHAT